MICLLIDTCTWKELVSKIEISSELLQIQFWVKNGYIQLLCPKMLKTEWNKHRIQEEENINKKTKKIIQYFELLIHDQPQLINQINEQKAIEKLKSQITIIDDLLLKEAKFVDESVWVRSHILLTKREKKPPFSNKENSENDASIIFSALEYIKQEELKDLYFVSSNVNDFGKKTKEGHEIQPEILESFENCSVKYFNKIHFFIDALKEKLPNLPILSSDNKDNLESNSYPKIDRSKKLLDQLYDYLTIRFKEIKVLPAKFWAGGYPFRTTNQPYFDYNLFALYTDNEELFNFFDSISIEHTGKLIFANTVFIDEVEKFEDKTRSILKILNQNAVFEIAKALSGKRKSIRFNEYTNCECIECSYRKLKLDKVLDLLSSDVHDSDKLEMYAYMNYQLGRFNISAELFIKLESIEKTKANFLKCYIINYNLSRLEPAIRYRFSGENINPDLVKSLEKIKREFEYGEIKKLPDRNIMKWIRDLYFFRDFQSDILEDSIKLKDYYQSQLYGGRGSNSFVWEIYTNQVLLDLLLNNNHIIFDQYSEFSQLIEVYIESLLTSYAVHESMYSRLEQFEDWIVRVLIFNGKPDSFVKYCKRYSITNIKYVSNSTTEDGFMDIIKNFFSCAERVNNLYIQNEWQNNYYFFEKYNKILSNILVLASYLELSPEQYAEIGTLLKDFLKIPVVINYHPSIKFIEKFISKKGLYFTNETLNDYLNLSFQSSYFHNEDYLTIVAKCFEKRAKTLDLKNEYLSKLNWQKNDKCSLCDHKHEPTILIPIYQLAKTKEDQEYIKSLILDSLNVDYNWRLYYLASVYDIVGISNEYFDKLINFQKKSGYKSPFFSNYSRDELNRDYRVGAIINLCFKYDIDLTEERFSHLKGFDPYYDWLMDMDNFDYSRFNPRWISEYATIHYFKKMKKNNVIKQKVFEYLKNNNDPLLKDNYIEAFS